VIHYCFPSDQRRSLHSFFEMQSLFYSRSYFLPFTSEVFLSPSKVAGGRTPFQRYRALASWQESPYPRLRSFADNSCPCSPLLRLHLAARCLLTPLSPMHLTCLPPLSRSVVYHYSPCPLRKRGSYLHGSTSIPRGVAFFRLAVLVAFVPGQPRFELTRWFFLVNCPLSI